MITIYHWKATGLDPYGRFENGISIFFDYPAPNWVVALTLQHLLGYIPYFWDAFPFVGELPNCTYSANSKTCVLNEPISIQTTNMQKRTVPAGTAVQYQTCVEILFSPIDL